MYGQVKTALSSRLGSFIAYVKSIKVIKGRVSVEDDFLKSLKELGVGITWKALLGQHIFDSSKVSHTFEEILFPAKTYTSNAPLPDIDIGDNSDATQADGEGYTKSETVKKVIPIEDKNSLPINTATSSDSKRKVLHVNDVSTVTLQHHQVVRGRSYM